MFVGGSTIQCHNCWTKDDDTCGFPETLGVPEDCESRDNVCKKVVTKAYSVIKKGRDSYYELGKSLRRTVSSKMVDTLTLNWGSL